MDLNTKVSRRRFLIVGCSAAVALASGCIAKEAQVEESATVSPTALAPTDTSVPATTTPSPTATSGTVPVTSQCPHGLVNDPYPGRCRLYTDKNGNGICDYSEVVTQATPSTGTISEAGPTATPSLSATQGRTQCPKGLVNDPYPGRCRLYTDKNGNGYCDYSEVS